MDTYIRGVDSIELLLDLIYEDTLLPIDTDDMEEVQVDIITSKKGIPSNTIRWTGTITDGKVVVLNAAAGSIAVYLDPSDTEDWPLLKYYARVIRTETDVNFGDGVKVSSAVVEAFKLIVE